MTLHALRGAVASREELRVRLAQQQAVARIGQLALTKVPLQDVLDEACCRVLHEVLPQQIADMMAETDRIRAIEPTTKVLHVRLYGRRDDPKRRAHRGNGLYPEAA